MQKNIREKSPLEFFHSFRIFYDILESPRKFLSILECSEILLNIFANFYII